MALITRRYIDNYTRSLETLSATAQEALSRRLAYVDFSNMTKAATEIVGIMEDVCGASAEASAQIAAAFYDAMSVYQTGDAYDAEPYSGHVPQATEKAVRGIFQEAVNGNIRGMADQLLMRADYEVKKAAGETVMQNSVADRRNVRYARVPGGGETCGFCIMLASRGFVYRSEATAGELNHYHANCRCRIVPGFKGVEVEGYDPAYYKELYEHPEKAKELRNKEEQEYRSANEGRTPDTPLTKEEAIGKAMSTDKPIFSFTDDTLFKDGQQIKLGEQYYHVVMHGTDSSAIVFGVDVTPQEFASILKQREDYKQGMPIALIGCNMGDERKVDVSFARELSSLLDTEVIAASKTLWTNGTKAYIIKDRVFDDSEPRGAFVTFEGGVKRGAVNEDDL